MNLGRKMRELIERPGLTLMPGVYDALSARIVEAGSVVIVCRPSVYKKRHLIDSIRPRCAAVANESHVRSC